MSKNPAEESHAHGNSDFSFMGPLAEKMNRNKRMLGLAIKIKSAIEIGNMGDLKTMLNECLAHSMDVSPGPGKFESKSEVFEHLKQQLMKAGINATLSWREPYDGHAHVILMSKDGEATKVLTVSTDLNEAPTAVSYSPAGSAKLDPSSVLLEFRTIIEKNVKPAKG